MTGAYQVFVEGPRERSPASVARLAAAIAARYGLPAGELEARLARGRFKVKAGVDRVTAEQYARDLEELGARCAIVDASGATVARGPAPAAAAAPPARTGAASLPPRAGGRTATPPTGLAAASAAASAADLGALGRADAPIALASLDGADATAIEPTAHLPASFGPPVPVGAPRERAPTPRPGTPRPGTPPPRDLAGRDDLFSAPDAELGEPDLDLAVDVAAERTKKAQTQAPPIATVAAATSAPLPAADSPTVEPVPTARAAAPRASAAVLADPRGRLAAGVALAILLAFVPVHFVARSRERSAFAEVDRSLAARYAAVQTLEDHAELASARAAALARKYGERRDIAITSLLMWAALAAGLAYVWFRRVPWDRITRA